jgi:hypothetical protein
MKKFAEHIFISYAHIDNKPLSPEQQGWITRFHQTLESLLTMRLGRDAAIWRDDKLAGNDVFAEEIVKKFKDVALLISILTPRYINSEWCTREAVEFCQQAENSGGLVVDNKSRVLKVVKTPLNSLETLPSIFSNVVGYDFYTREEGKPLELDPEYGEKFKQDYNRKVALLAFDAAALIGMLEAESPSDAQDPITSASAKSTIYLAECSADRREVREKLMVDLKLNGYVVVPEQPLPMYDEAEYLSSAKGLLQASSLSVHLVGGTYDATPAGLSQKSIGVLQNELAAQASKEGCLKRVIWLPTGTRSEQEQQQAFINALHEDAEAQAGAELITGGLEELKSTIYRKLKVIELASLSQAKQTEQPEGETGKLVYLVCDEKDRKPSVPLRRWLIDQGLEVKLPLFAGDATAVRETNENLLAICDAVLLFYGAGDECWKTAIDSDHRKIRAYRGTNPLPARYTYLGEPITDHKQDMLDMKEPCLIDGLGGFDADSMGGFLAAIRNQGVPS